MLRMEKGEFMKTNFVVCECGYDNQKNSIDTFGTCLKCGKILNERAYFKYNMRKLTRSWKIYNSIR